MPLEAVCMLAAPHHSPDLFVQQDILWFVDNEGVVSTMVRGAAKPEDAQWIAGASRYRFMQLR
eukprot:11189761-Lingulodinium_polyedra.AAC.1